MFNNILLAVDGSPHAERAAAAAAEMARCNKSQLTVMVAYDPVPAYLGEPNLQAAITARMREAEDIIAKALSIIGDVGVPVKTTIVEGPPAEAILNVAEARQVDLIVMGSRGLGRLAGLLLGSQSQKVVSHATCPVLIVR
ncbi:MAG: universal stress protein [Anaerolineales bacterium]